jgi:hypothetical protein
LSKQLLHKLLLNNKKQSRLLSAWIALFVGCSLLLVSIMIWSTFQSLLEGKNNQDSLGSTFLTISKVVDDAAMAHKSKTQISVADIDKIKHAPQVQDVGTLTPAQFKVSASLGSGPIAFYTLLFLEAAPDRFMDQMPTSWQWHEGDNTIPIILSRDFLNMYNYLFAPSQGLPILSEQTVKAIGFTLTISEGSTQVNYRAQVEGFSDRISSVLVPQSFIDYGNKKFNPTNQTNISRAIIKVADPSNKAFVEFLQDNQYSTNAEQLRYSKMRSIVEIVSVTTGFLAIVLVFIGALVFILFIELTLSQAQEAVSLLLQIGYSPKMLSKYLGSKYIPIMLSALLAAIVVAISLQYFAALQLQRFQLSIDKLPSTYVWMAVGVSMIVLLWQINQSIRKALLK